ncbi:steroid 5-alpha reductase family enzyme [Tamaricihabitans halophyticus]|uniref:Steroid 5-alpha reductase family enzyme n=1 Tax=Tamaricihabitans halophyticus TaxID=1262583 RepID=A0A4R2Q7N3_9PSEU|nr:DUF1295 domain-containing protein [Tamaricihabitans halophyticus]TCP44770.1 steroid 5-alpha reductase family enzyme [Tamaricihabitans halophyticus]
MTFQVAGLTLGAALILVTIAFGVACLRRRFDTIDGLWGVGFAAIAVVGWWVAPVVDAPGAIGALLTVLWGTRLSLHIYQRNRAKPEDERYVAMLRRARRRPLGRMYFRAYLTQGVVMWFVSAPVQFALHEPATDGMRWLLWPGVLLWTVGFAFESVGDLQLRRFARDPANANSVLERGLWRYTRHPNYFGDACVWWGLYVVACTSWPGVATIASPLLMTWLLARGTGKPMLERDLVRRRPGYADYVARTSGFVPLPPKRSD